MCLCAAAALTVITRTEPRLEPEQLSALAASFKSLMIRMIPVQHMCGLNSLTEVWMRVHLSIVSKSYLTFSITLVCLTAIRPRVENEYGASWAKLEWI